MLLSSVSSTALALVPASAVDDGVSVRWPSPKADPFGVVPFAVPVVIPFVVSFVVHLIESIIVPLLLTCGMSLGRLISVVKTVSLLLWALMVSA